MWDPVIKSRGSSRLLAGAVALAASLLAITLALGFPEPGEERAGNASQALGGLRPSAPHGRVGLADNRPAHVDRRHVSGRLAVGPEPKPTPAEASEPDPPAGAGGRLVAAVAPATASRPPSAREEPGEAAPPAPEPPPAPAPQPPPTPPPAPPPPSPSPPPANDPPAPPPSAAGEVLFWATFESGDFSGWHVQSLPNRASTSSSEPFEGDRAARFEVRDGDVEPATGSERSELSGPTFDEGQDLYIRDAIRIPSGNSFSAPWQIIQQLHEEDWGGSPGMAVFLSAEPALRLGAGDSSPIYWTSSRLEVDRWYDLVYRVLLSQDSSEGFVEVWLDGVQQTLANGRLRAYGQTIQASQTYIKAGIYRSRSSTGTSIVEHDEIVIGTSLAAVNGG